MKISEKPLLRGKLIKRYKRFLTDVELDTGELVTATCPNTGSMMGLLDPGNPVWLSVSDNPARKYAHTWEMVEAVNAAGQPARVGLNTGLPNKLVEEAIVSGKVPLLSGYDTLKREQKYGKNSRIDILLSDGADGRLAYVEVKNVTLSREGGIAEFPDAVTERGAKHLMELADMVREGHRAVMVYLAQRSDAARFRLAHDIDPAYMDAWKAARDAGVESIALACQMGDDEIVADRLIDLDVT
jgi:sugar fermentation stimulation protein A